LTAGERTSNCATATWQAPPGPDPPVLSVPVAITRPNDPGQPGAAVTWPEVTATGGVAPVTIACTHESRSMFAIGTTAVGCTATDSAAAASLLTQSVASTSFTVTVNDVEPPTIDALVPAVSPTPDGRSAVVSFAQPAASDNSGVAPTVACTPTSGSTL